MSKSKDRTIPDDVWVFLDKASAGVGRHYAERFSQSMYSQMLESLESPIEDLFYIACNALCETEGIEVNPEPEFGCLPDGKIDFETFKPGRGIVIRPQAKIGPYRVDFLMEMHGFAPEEIYTPVIVELDGHDFHDKDKRQRSYEKARDRFLVKEKYKVLHFTGSDVVADPYRVAFEALEMLAVFVGSGRDQYDPQNPLGID